MGAKGSKIAAQIESGTDNDHRHLDVTRMQKLIAGLTHKPSNRKPQQIKLPGDDNQLKLALSCDNLFSKDECKALIKLTKSLGYKKGSQSKGIPMATNVTLNSRTISELIMERMKNYVPAEFRGRHMLGADEKIRFLKFDAIKKATDISSEQALNWLAIGKHPLSAVVFLNSNFKGGSTLFPDPRAERPPTHTPVGLGDALIFEDSVKTLALPVTKGCKYVMRVDFKMQNDAGSSGELCGFDNGEVVDTMYQITLDHLGRSSVFGVSTPRVPAEETAIVFPNSPTAVADDPSALGGEQHHSSYHSLPRSDCSHTPLASAEEMSRGSFVQTMSPIPDRIPDLDHAFHETFQRQHSHRVAMNDSVFQRQHSHRVAMDEPSLAAFPSLRSLEGEAIAIPRAQTPARGKVRMMPFHHEPKQPHQLSRTIQISGNVKYPSLMSDDILPAGAE